MSEKSWWESLLETVGGLGETALNSVYGSKAAQSQAELYTGQQAKQDDREFWHKFAIVSAACVGGLVLGKIFKLY
ncbi:MAG: hypothetical protein ACI4RJ_01745 [Alphaproteobacteria bacterium]